MGRAWSQPLLRVATYLILALVVGSVMGRANALPGTVALKSIGRPHARQLARGVLARGRGVLELVGTGGAGAGGLFRRTLTGEKMRRVALWAKDKGEEGVKIGGKHWDMNKASPFGMMETVREPPTRALLVRPIFTMSSSCLDSLVLERFRPRPRFLLTKLH